jgi:hypothetical protein
VRLSVILLAIFASTALHGATPVIQPGEWEITMQIEGVGSAEPMVTRVCMTRQDVAALAPPKGKGSDDCKVTGGGLTGPVLSYAVKCDKKKVTTQTRITFSGDRYEGTVTITTDGREIRQIMNARRIGECEFTPSEGGPTQ